MMQTCKCGKEFLSEADPYVVLPKPSGVEFNCGCFFDIGVHERFKQEAEKDFRKIIIWFLIAVTVYFASKLL